MIRSLLLPAALALTGGGLFWQATDGLRAVTAEGARRIAIAEAPRSVPDVTLQAMDGHSIPLKPENGEIVLVEFIYTTCPDICQLAAIDFSTLRDRLEEQGLPVRMLSVSFDPERDTPDALRHYGEAHGADGRRWTVARPETRDLQALLSTFEVTVIPDEWGGFQHNAAILLIDRTGRFAALYDIDAVAEVAEAVKERLG
ncbi:SCO family protein [Coralliovum pocilloporae]|uniref:SCO family protein n=1 Tax=Coralliovum pocilloporae TaxID=3066369 RepID=UPI0033076532